MYIAFFLQSGQTRALIIRDSDLVTSFLWFSARLQYLQCINTGDSRLENSEDEFGLIFLILNMII